MLPSSEYVTADISQEEWREAFKTDADGDVIWLYRINNPATLIFRRGGTTHRVIDRDGIVHLYPMDALLRWKPRDNNDPVQF